MDQLITLLVNEFGGVRTENRNGRAYLVANIVSIVPGVLNGSNGPLLYTLEEIQKEQASWNGMPIVWGHPMQDGKPVTARNPKVLDAYGLGTVYNTKAEGKLSHEGWFDVEWTNRVDLKIVPALLRGDKLEVSTGLWSRNVPVSNGVHEGVAYTARATDHRPDHIAVLVNGVGACDINRGCGLNVNCGGTCGTKQAIPIAVSEQEEHTRRTFWQMLANLLTGNLVTAKPDATAQPAVTAPTQPTVNTATNPPAGDISVDKKQLIDQIIANNVGWAEEDRVVLNASSDARLKVLLDSSTKQKANQEIADIARKGFASGQDAIVYNETTKQFEKKVETPATPAAPSVVPAANRLTEEEQYALSYARNAMQQEKDGLLSALSSHMVEGPAKVATVSLLKTKPIEELRLLVNMQPQAGTGTPYQPRTDYRLMPGTVNSNQPLNGSDDEALPVPEVPWAVAAK